jgi:hypothetical protein
MKLFVFVSVVVLGLALCAPSTADIMNEINDLKAEIHSKMAARDTDADQVALSTKVSQRATAQAKVAHLKNKVIKDIDRLEEDLAAHHVALHTKSIGG